MILQTKGQVTAAELARQLEISTRTARRDLEALAMSGVPIYSQPGRGGGWRLIGGAKTDLTGLSSDEARAVFLALGHQRDANPMLEGALRKLVVALPERFRDDALAATAAIRIDPTGRGQIGPIERPQFVDVLAEAVIAGVQVGLRYTTPGNDPSDRVVHPLGLVTKRGIWYLVANTERGIRTYRLSRVENVARLDEPVDRPADFDLEATWAAIVTTFESSRSGLAVRVVVDATAMTPLRYVFGARCQVEQELADGRYEVTLVETSAGPLAAQLAGFGRAVDLIDPPREVTDAMVRITAELVSRWLVDEVSDRSGLVS